MIWIINGGFILAATCDFCVAGAKSVQIKDCFHKQQSNGCGAASWSWYTLWLFGYLLDEQTTKCCDQHDVCYLTCGRSYVECETEFEQCLEGNYKTLSVGTGIGGCESYRATQYQVCACVPESVTATEVEAQCRLDEKKRQK